MFNMHITKEGGYVNHPPILDDTNFAGRLTWFLFLILWIANLTKRSSMDGLLQRLQLNIIIYL